MDSNTTLWELSPGVRFLFHPSRNLGQTYLQVFFHADSVTDRSLYVRMLAEVFRDLWFQRKDALDSAGIARNVAVKRHGNMTSLGFSVSAPSIMAGSLDFLRASLHSISAVMSEPLQAGALPADALQRGMNGMARYRGSLAWTVPYILSRCMAQMSSNSNPTLRLLEEFSATGSTLWDVFADFVTTAPVSILIAGDVDPEAAAEVVSAFSLSLPARGRQFPPAVPPSDRPLAPTIAIEHGKGEMGGIAIAIQSNLTIHSPNYPALLDLGALLVTDQASMIPRYVRWKSGAAYVCHGQYDANLGHIYIAISAVRSQVCQLSERLLDVIGGPLQGTASHRELLRAKHAAARDQYLALDNTAWALDILEEQLAGGRVWPLADLAQAALRCSDEEILAAAKSSWVDAVFIQA